MVRERDRRHADLLAGFLSPLGLAFVAGAFLQLSFAESGSHAAVSATIFLVGFALHGVAHMVIARSS
jgi:hypothetical protein